MSLKAPQTAWYMFMYRDSLQSDLLTCVHLGASLVPALLGSRCSCCTSIQQWPLWSLMLCPGEEKCPDI